MSIHQSEVEVLKKRSLEFLEEARMALGRGAYDVACFLAEQALQLFLKSALLKVAGDYPRAGVRRLLGELSRILKSREIMEFVRANRARLSALEDAYMMARYFVKEYDEEDAKDMVELAWEAMKLVGRVVGLELH